MKAAEYIRRIFAEPRSACDCPLCVRGALAGHELYIFIAFARAYGRWNRTPFTRTTWS